MLMFVTQIYKFAYLIPTQISHLLLTSLGVKDPNVAPWELSGEQLSCSDGSQHCKIVSHTFLSGFWSSSEPQLSD